jgi:curli production assembly/transport component CsgF
MRKYYLAIPAIASLVIAALAPVRASELVYHPVSPTFGGNPLNGTFLLSQAQAQGEGVKSGSQGPDLSGLNNALSNLGNGAIVIGGTGAGGSGNNGSNGSGGSGSMMMNSVRATVP